MHLLGVRGSTPAPGAAFVSYGGHTSCVALAADADAVPTLVLDAGTGIRNLGALLGPAPFRGTLLLTHLHWDHTQGMPFAGCLDREDAQVDLLLPGRGLRTAAAIVGRAMSPPSFPVRVAGLRGHWRTRVLRPSTRTFGAFTVTAAAIPHKGGRTFGYRISADGATIVYMPDHTLDGVAGPAALALAQGADVLIHDASNLIGDRRAATAFGHSTVDDAIAFARQAGVGQLILSHHGPSRTDTELDAVAALVETVDPATGAPAAGPGVGVAAAGGPGPGDDLVVRMAREGTVLRVSSAAVTGLDGADADAGPGPGTGTGTGAGSVAGAAPGGRTSGGTVSVVGEPAGGGRARRPAPLPSAAAVVRPS